MNGPEHYAEAERLIGPDAVPMHYTGEDYDSFRADNLAMAQVHATLALAAATFAAGVLACPQDVISGVPTGAKWGELLS